MTTYDVCLHREITLSFYALKADSPEEAADIAREAAPDEAGTRVESDDLHAQVSVADGEHHPPVTLVFEAGRLNQVAPRLLAALHDAGQSLRNIIEAAAHGEPYTADELARLFVDVSVRAGDAVAEATGRQEGGRP